jgi:mono/diheme cytochrome c family protein
MARFSACVLCVAIASTLLTVRSGALAQTGTVERGRQFARANCERCHSVDRVTPSNLPLAPPFRLLGQRYPIDTLRESLAEGIVTSHQNMPQFRLEPDQINDFLAFLNSLQVQR